MSRDNTKNILIGNRIPKDFFVSKGKGESNITVHAGSYHLALKDAGIECYNHMCYSSILPGIAIEVLKPKNYIHGSVAETITAAANAQRGKRATAGIIYGWLFNRKTNQKYGGLVCEYNGNFSEEQAGKSLRASLNELYTHGFEEDYELKEIKLYTNSIVPKKKFGTALVALVFVNYVYPVLG